MGDKLCCGRALIRAGYTPLSERLLEYGKEAYAEVTGSQEVAMWVFSFFDESKMCEKCRSDFATMYEWFQKYGLFDSPTGCVRIVVEGSPGGNLIYTDLGMEKLPAHLFCDSRGRIVDILFQFPTVQWLEKHVLPFIQSETAGF